MAKDDYDELRKRYVQRLQETLNRPQQARTRQYQEFREECMPKPLTWYEKACNQSLKVLPLKADPKKRDEIQNAIDICHLRTTPDAVMSFSIVAPILFILTAFLVFVILPMAFNASGSLFLAAYATIAGLILIFPLARIPYFLAQTWRMKASNQMVLCIFYVVTYMRHTSNLELAIDFAAEHLDAPLSLDMKKIVWDIETEKYDSLRESLEAYLQGWQGWNDEFIESMHLVESSLVETSETRRVEALDKSLSVMLDETYEKMLHYAHNLKSPLTTLHMLGIILPILGLVILPLMVSFMTEVRWYHLFVLYNVTLPLGVYFLGRSILAKRPTGYGSSETELKRLQAGERPIRTLLGAMTPLFLAAMVGGLLLLIGAIPLLMHLANPDVDLVHYGADSVNENDGPGCLFGFCVIDSTVKEQTDGATFWFNEYRVVVINQETQESIVVGPFGLLAALISLCVPLAIGLSIGLYYKLRAKDAMKKREEAKKLELEFSSALFQLGNRLADGLPLEIAFSKVAATMPDSVSGRFFQQVTVNITKLGLSVEDAIFHEKYGAIHSYPSNLIESSMKVLVESSKKGPVIASLAIINVANYIKEMHRVDERLKDLMADVISSMQSQITFLTPTIAGIVMGITSMITAILGKLNAKMVDLTAQTGDVSTGMAMGTQLLGSLGGGAVSTYHFQIVVGLYVVEIIFILTILVNGIQNGPDKVSEEAMLGENMIHSTLTYVGLALVVMILFNVVAASILPAG